jgi:hypothetical protein
LTLEARPSNRWTEPVTEDVEQRIATDPPLDLLCGQLSRRTMPRG